MSSSNDRSIDIARYGTFVLLSTELTVPSSLRCGHPRVGHVEVLVDRCQQVGREEVRRAALVAKVDQREVPLDPAGQDEAMDLERRILPGDMQDELVRLV
jgi:hypothetical protein